ncbi:DsrE family protein [Acidianus manzaensis]|uniref:Uncharacterized protein n=1 Tax=Acidianus manzaensis TaxID=282676 RepID=A0A1W6JYB3_9CREN|nr:DsrE family protein [Acidianus manzaensis]ARM75235.1 hypothetical protein B6F84_03770 [Acidianus manzaensis]
MPGKIVVMINSGKDQKPKIMTALTLALVGKQKGLFEDLQLIFFGPSEQLIAEKDPDIINMINQINQTGEKMYACQLVGDSLKITDKLKQTQGLTVTLVGPLIADLVSKGYEILNF